MKYKHTLHVDQKEIEIMNEALRMYRANVDKRYQEESFGLLSKNRFASYRCKVHSMSNVLNAIKKTPKSVISESSEYENNTTVVKTEG